MKKFRYVLTALILLLVFVFLFDFYLTARLNYAENKYNMLSLKHEFGNVVRDKGIELKERMAEDRSLMLFGSSELGSQATSSPVNMFPYEGADYDVSIFGRPYTQSLQQASLVGSTSGLGKDSKVALVLSMQWFFYKDGVETKDYVCNFSQYQFYKVMNDKKISDENKLYYAKRTAELIKDNEDFKDEKLYADLYSDGDTYSRVMLTILKPYYKFNKYILGMKDKIQSYKALVKAGGSTMDEVKSIDWEKERAEKEKESAANTDNNPLKVNNDYFDQYLRENYDTLKDASKEVNMENSKEYEDYRLFLNICKDKGIKPLIILMPVNGIYYDYVGIDADKRKEYYDRVTAMAEEYGFDVMNLNDKDYEPYYMTDVMHLSSKGWLDVVQKIGGYYSK